jgi:hypothetical protein
MTDGRQVDGARREEIHLPGQSLLPLFAAIGITFALVGLILAWWFVAFGLFVTAVTAVIWIRTVRDEIDRLPSERR